jgi:hypothetical protein
LKSTEPDLVPLPKINPGDWKFFVALNQGQEIASVDGAPFSDIAVHKLFISALRR